MAMRKLALPADLEPLGDLLINSFHYPDNPEWSAQTDEIEGIRSTIANLKRIFPLYRIIRLFSVSMRDALYGYLWEEDGKMVAACTYSRYGTTENWLIGNVSVLPEYRRRGLARKLVDTCIEAIREDHGGEVITLDVIAGNVPAYSLYESQGFEHYASNTAMDFKPEKVIEKPDVPDGYLLEILPDDDWQTRVALAKRTIPARVQEYDPVNKARYYRAPFARLFTSVMRRSEGVVPYDFTLKEAKSGLIAAIGYTSARTRSGGRHSTTIVIDPEHSDVTEFMIQNTLHHVTVNSIDHIVDTNLSEWRYFTIAQHEQAGFEKRTEWHRMGLRLQ